GRLGPGREIATLDGRGVGLSPPRDLLGPYPTVGRRIRPDAPGGPAQQRDGPVGVSSEEVDVARSELRQALEELRLIGLPGLFPGGLPGLVRGEIRPGVEVLPAELVVLLHREVVEVLEYEA